MGINLSIDCDIYKIDTKGFSRIKQVIQIRLLLPKEEKKLHLNQICIPRKEICHTPCLIQEKFRQFRSIESVVCKTYHIEEGG